MWGVTMMRGTLLAAVLLVAVVVGLTVLPGVAFADIVVNGGFETGDLTGWTTNPAPAGGFPWTVETTGGLGPGFANSGNYYASTGCVGAGCLDPITGAWLTQTLPTIAGQTYDLSFAYDPYLGSPVELQVQWGGATVLDLMNSNSPGYTVYTVDDLLATSASTPLTFLGRDDPSFDGLDDVAVSPTPEPSTLVLVTSVLPCFAGMRVLWLRKLRVSNGVSRP